LQTHLIFARHGPALSIDPDFFVEFVADAGPLRRPPR
jgi:hypothetical protein